jgi:hypothetical protein
MNEQFNHTKHNLSGLNLTELLEEISVQEIDEDCAKANNIEGLIGWFGVVTDLGIIAYFGLEIEAFRFRLDYINRILNS